MLASAAKGHFRRSKVSAPNPAKPRRLPRHANKAPASLVALAHHLGHRGHSRSAKADAARIAELTATADAHVPKGLTGLDLPIFYYKRGQAHRCSSRRRRACRRRLAVSNGPGQDYKNVGSRYDSFCAAPARCRPAQTRNALVLKQLAGICQSGQGKAVGLNYTLAVGHIRNGDTNARKAMSRAIVRCSLKRNDGLPFDLRHQLAGDRRGRQRGVAESRAICRRRGCLSQGGPVLHGFVEDASTWESKPPEGDMERAADWALLEGRVKVKQAGSAKRGGRTARLLSV